ncbi:Sulfate adenylyltransferase subunit 1 / Adenylyl-sulfate kinase [Sphingomonas sp. EC-HK361]|uniref:sulfate adenylyltransferase subunit CysN n=1 Tax=Sphingomonas sp. EC-HK361 TaxID=2038397 RepID=UPI001251B050|nr:sulfate adenylyltransferase subunit CysN [Sphingomonas sp. EC-HK361]VVT22586.1 Sulfate adenylyltransferase subunit 1 / Adenylyl-sulfate kinase [Sphingomonas sp. EC-HK361]
MATAISSAFETCATPAPEGVVVPFGYQQSLLRFITCGSVDDGKSTLIGRMLYDSKSLLDDQLTTLAEDSRKAGGGGGRLDFASLVDGLSAEREQGITIDVAYRFFNSSRRKFIVADTPGHEQYTRNMVTGASTADLAVVLIDARKGVLTQTRRHSYLVHLVGIRQIILAVNKMDLVGYDQATFDAIVADYGDFAASIGIEAFTAIPIAAIDGDNIAASATTMPWYAGPTLLDALDHAELPERRGADAGFAMQVQWVNRPNLDFRGVSGTVAAGTVRPGDRVRLAPSGLMTQVARIVTFDGDLPVAHTGQAVTLAFAEDVDCSRGDVVAAASHPIEVADQFEVDLVWMNAEPMLPQRPYLLKMGARSATATVTDLKYRLDVNTLAKEAAKTLPLNGIGVCNISLDRQIPFAPFADNIDLGSFILIDRATNETVGAGMIRFALRRTQNIHWQSIDVTREAHARQKQQHPRVLWFTGLSGAGKSTIANLVEKKLLALGKHSFLLDGDNVRHGLSRDLGFTDADRVENIRRIGEVAKIMTDAGLIVLTAFISPFRAEREMVRRMIPAGEFIEIHVDTPLDVAEARDVKGLYGRARRGELANFTGIDSPYETPEAPELVVDTCAMPPEEAAERVVTHLLALDGD